MTAEIIEVSTTQMTSELGRRPVIGSLQPPARLDVNVWTVTQVRTDEHARGRSSLVILDGLRQALTARIYQAGNEVTIEDVDTGIFGTGADLAAAVRDLREALQDHLEVLASEHVLSPNLHQQLEILRSYFS
jgi:predicted RNase H-like HicB family nuclease